jgi:putative hemolysin
VLIDFGVLFLLLLLNGFFAMAELAIVSAKRARVRQLGEDGAFERKGARLALELADDPSSFLSVVQIGMTLISIFAGAYGGRVFAPPLQAWMETKATLAPFARTLSLAVTVGGVSYLTLVLGELLPKRIGLAYAEPIALRVAGVMRSIAAALMPIVWVLRLSTELLLHFLGLAKPAAAAVTEEEVKDMIAEGAETGVFEQAEKKMIEGVMRLADRTVRMIMTPRIDMCWLCLDDKPEERVKIIKASGYSRFPVMRGDLEEAVGVVHAKDLLNATFAGRTPRVEEVMRKPLIVPDTTPVLRLVDLFKQSKQHLAVVVDEYGSIEGLATVTDILESITGEMPEVGQSREDKPVRREDGSWLIDGMMAIDEVEALIGFRNMRDGDDYQTIAGFVIEKLGRIPAAGDHFHWAGARFEVVDMDQRRVDKVLIAPPEPEDDDEDRAG